MKTYTFVLLGEQIRTKNTSHFELMQLCFPGGVEYLDNGAICIFFDKNDAIKATERLAARGIQICSEDIFEDDNPCFVEDRRKTEEEDE